MYQKQVSKVTWHFVWGHLSKKQAVAYLLPPVPLPVPWVACCDEAEDEDGLWRLVVLWPRSDLACRYWTPPSKSTWWLPGPWLNWAVSACSGGECHNLDSREYDHLLKFIWLTKMIFFHSIERRATNSRPPSGLCRHSFIHSPIPSTMDWSHKRRKYVYSECIFDCDMLMRYVSL